MKKNIIATILSATLIASLALTGCGNTSDLDATETVVESTEEAVAVEEDATEEEFVEDETLSEESTEEVESTEGEETETESETENESESEINSENADATAEESAGYTYTDMSTTMYAKSTVTVRDLPSTDGKKLGSLSTNQGVAVTGQCNETGWYRIEYNGNTGYVSNKYLSDEQATAQNTTNGDTSNGASGSTPGTDTGAINAGGASTSTNANGLDRSTAEAVWAKVNAERSAAGLSTLAWDETAYSFACSRAQQIVSDFSHDGNTDYYGENIYNGSNGADRIHQAWHNSTGHYNNYMNTMYTAGACAVYLVDGYAYAVETFVPSWYSGNSSSTDTQTDDSSEETTNSDDSASTYPTWTASNGVVLTLYGNRCTGANSADTDAVSAAYDEWIAAGAPGDYTK